jgi:hypothetical protein
VTTHPGPKLDPPARKPEVLTDRLGNQNVGVLVELAALTANQAQTFREAHSD